MTTATARRVGRNGWEAGAITVAKGLAKRLRRVPVTVQAISRAKKSLRSQRDKRNEPAGKKGYEYVVEWLFRSAVEEYASQQFDLPSGSVHCRCYSSHFHTTNDDHNVWKEKWMAFRQSHPDVDTADAGHSRRADLFLDVGNGSLLSIEFKYVGPRRSPNIANCVAQVLQHRTKHRVSILVIYVAEPVSARCEEALQQIAKYLDGKAAFVTAIRGPGVTFD